MYQKLSSDVSEVLVLTDTIKISRSLMIIQYFLNTKFQTSMEMQPEDVWIFL